MEVINGFKGFDLVGRVLEELWIEVCNIVQEAVIKAIPKKKKCKKEKWLPEEALQILFITTWKKIPGVTGIFGLGVQNEAGQRLTEFCQENVLVTANNLFQQHKRQLYTWTSPNGQY